MSEIKEPIKAWVAEHPCYSQWLVVVPGELHPSGFGQPVTIIPGHGYTPPSEPRYEPPPGVELPAGWEWAREFRRAIPGDVFIGADGDAHIRIGRHGVTANQVHIIRPKPKE